ncbi:MAG TPA: hypothetical protein VI357_25405 [Mycobacteriales bacterium]
MSAHDKLPLRSPCDSMSVEELARLQGVKPVTSLEDMACDVFESDEEVEEFIAFTYRCRREGRA